MRRPILRALIQITWIEVPYSIFCGLILFSRHIEVCPDSLVFVSAVNDTLQGVYSQLSKYLDEAVIEKHGGNTRHSLWKDMLRACSNVDASQQTEVISLCTERYTQLVQSSCCPQNWLIILSKVWRIFLFFKVCLLNSNHMSLFLYNFSPCFLYFRYSSGIIDALPKKLTLQAISDGFEDKLVRHNLLVECLTSGECLLEGRISVDIVRYKGESGNKELYLSSINNLQTRML